MSHGIEIVAAQAAMDPDMPRILQPLARLLQWVNQALVVQDEAAVFCLVGATFLCGAFVQSMRGHVGIEAIAGLLPRSVNQVRLVFVDLLGSAFCSFFAWKSWTLFHEAWVEQQTTSSSWAPPLWIPYGLMAAGMTLLSLQLLVQLSATANGLRKQVSGVSA
jgi:TRAP-type C4-dicarboxylate transport system permease small subunit